MKLYHSILVCGCAAFISLGSLTTVQAQNSQSHVATSSAANSQEMIKTPVTNLYRTLSTLQQTNHTTVEQKNAILAKVLENSYDFPTILGNTVGYRYNSLSQQEKEALLKAFKAYTVARYYSSFGKETGTGFKILPKVKNAPVNDDRIVMTAIGDANDMESATEIDYLLRKTPQGWKIVDVLLKGNISQIAIQHGDFNSSLAKDGIRGLIEMLNKKTQSLSQKQ